jgi:hypothetical protein
MNNRAFSLASALLIFLLTVLLNVALNYLTNSQPKGVMAQAQHWSLPLAGVIVLLIVGIQLGLYLVERPRRGHLAAVAQVDPKTLRDMCSGRRRPNFTTLQAVSAALRLTVADVIIPGGDER